MPPNSTQNLNARLTLVNTSPPRPGSPAVSLNPPPVQSSAAPVRIVGEPVPYQGGYHLSF